MANKKDKNKLEVLAAIDELEKNISLVKNNRSDLLVAVSKITKLNDKTAHLLLSAIKENIDNIPTLNLNKVKSWYTNTKIKHKKDLIKYTTPKNLSKFTTEIRFTLNDPRINNPDFNIIEKNKYVAVCNIQEKEKYLNSDYVRDIKQRAATLVINCIDHITQDSKYILDEVGTKFYVDILKANIVGINKKFYYYKINVQCENDPKGLIIDFELNYNYKGIAEVRVNTYDIEIFEYNDLKNLDNYTSAYFDLIANNIV